MTKVLKIIYAILFVFLIFMTFLVDYAQEKDQKSIEQGAEAYDNAEYSKAFELLSPLADLEYANALAILGLMYSKGNGVEQSHEKSKELFLRAADLNNSFASRKLGLMYDLGWGVPRDVQKARKYYSKSAELGDTDAQYLLSILNAFGEGLPKESIVNGNEKDNINQSFKTFSHNRFAEKNTVTKTYISADGSYKYIRKESTQGQTEFLGEEAISIRYEGEFIDTASGDTSNAHSGSYYFSIQNDNRKYLGTSDDDVMTTSSTTKGIPSTVRIGDSGIIGHYVSSDGTKSDEFYRVVDAGDGRAKFHWLTTFMDSSDKITGKGVESETIDSEGNRQGPELIMFFVNTESIIRQGPELIMFFVNTESIIMLNQKQ